MKAPSALPGPTAAILPWPEALGSTAPTRLGQPQNIPTDVQLHHQEAERPARIRRNSGSIRQLHLLFSPAVLLLQHPTAVFMAGTGSPSEASSLYADQAHS